MTDDPLGDAIRVCADRFEGCIYPRSSKDGWVALRRRNRAFFRRWRPGRVRLLSVAESPPLSGCDFYRLPEWA